MENSKKEILIYYLILITLLVLFVTITLLIKSMNPSEKKLTEQELEQKALELNNKFLSMELIDSFSPSIINGIITYSDSDFQGIKEYYDILNISQENYPDLNGIFFFRKINICNGIVHHPRGIIYVYACNRNIKIRNYFAEPKDWEFSTLAHELSHYRYYLLGYYESMNNEDLQDDNAYEWTNTTIKLGVN